MIFSIDAEKAFDKPQHPFIHNYILKKKPLVKLETEGNTLT
jgi:hypothetical protein